MLESVLFPIVSKINEYLSNYILIFLLVGVGLWYSIKTRFVQVRCFGEGMKKFFGEMNLRGGAQKSGMTSFQALATAIAAQVGTGNIVGASGAILTSDSVTVAVPASQSYLLGRSVQIRYGGKTITATVTDTGGFASYGRVLDLAGGCWKAFGFSSCYDWGVRAVQYRFL